MGADAEARRRLSPPTSHTPSLALSALCRQIPEVGAVCGKAARTVLCGGCAVMRIPTATAPLAMTNLFQPRGDRASGSSAAARSEEHTSELQSPVQHVCR